MKLTKSKLRQIIKEELQAVLKESNRRLLDPSQDGPSPPQPARKAAITIQVATAYIYKEWVAISNLLNAPEFLKAKKIAIRAAAGLKKEGFCRWKGLTWPRAVRAIESVLGIKCKESWSSDCTYPNQVAKTVFFKMQKLSKYIDRITGSRPSDQPALCGEGEGAGTWIK
jgi:hypothetical protein